MQQGAEAKKFELDPEEQETVRKMAEFFLIRARAGKVGGRDVEKIRALNERMKGQKA